MIVKTVYSKLGIVYFDFNTSKIDGTPELREAYLQEMNDLSLQTNSLEDSLCIFDQPTQEEVQTKGPIEFITKEHK